MTFAGTQMAWHYAEMLHLNWRGRRSSMGCLLENSGLQETRRWREMDSNPRSPVRSLTQTRSNGDVQHPPVVAAAFRGGPRRLEMGEVITAEGKAILNQRSRNGHHRDLCSCGSLAQDAGMTRPLIGALRQPDCGPGNNQQCANQGASAGGSGEGGNDDESQEVREEDPGGRTRYGNHAGPGG
jgi:hypothetical protein